MSKLRVIQWATGSVGREALKAIIMHPDLERVGVRVHSEEELGRDAGELCGMPLAGVQTTSDDDAILACHADCVAYMPRLAHVSLTGAQHEIDEVETIVAGLREAREARVSPSRTSRSRSHSMIRATATWTAVASSVSRSCIGMPSATRGGWHRR